MHSGNRYGTVDKAIRRSGSSSAGRYPCRYIRVPLQVLELDNYQKFQKLVPKIRKRSSIDSPGTRSQKSLVFVQTLVAARSSDEVLANLYLSYRSRCKRPVGSRRESKQSWKPASCPQLH